MRIEIEQRVAFHLLPPDAVASAKLAAFPVALPAARGAVDDERPIGPDEIGTPGIVEKRPEIRHTRSDEAQERHRPFVERAGPASLEEAQQPRRKTRKVAPPYGQRTVRIGEPIRNAPEDRGSGHGYDGRRTETAGVPRGGARPGRLRVDDDDVMAIPLQITCRHHAYDAGADHRYCFLCHRRLHSTASAFARDALSGPG